MCSLFPKAVVIDFIPIIVFILFQGEEFNVYEKYVDDMLAPRGKERLNTLLQRPDISNTLQVSFNLPAHFSSYFQIRVVFLHINICYGYSLEAPRRGTSSEYHNIRCCTEIRNKKYWNILVIKHLIWSRSRWLSWMHVRLETRRSWVQPPPRLATFFRGD